jgi:hypothetical protein
MGEACSVSIDYQKQVNDGFFKTNTFLMFTNPEIGWQIHKAGKNIKSV